MRHLLRTALVLAPLFLAGSAEAASTTLVISEFRTRGPNGGNDEFVELHNVSNAPVSLNGFALNASTGAGVTSELRRLPNVSLQPGGFYLLAYQGNQSYSGTTTPDGRYTAGTIPDDGGIALVRRNTQAIVDQVGMGAGSAYQEGTPLAPMSGSLNQSYERKSGGCTANQDTDDNSADFRLNGSQSFPQNLATDCASCVGVVCTKPPNRQCWLNAGTCVSGTCIYPQRAEGARCSDQDACTRPDACDAAGACAAGPAVVCNTPPKPFCSDPQTLVTSAPTGACSTVGGCSYAQTTTPCQFGCNGTTGSCNPDRCQNIGCSTPPTNGCYAATGTCQQNTGTCLYPKKAVGTACTDSNACTTGDQCDANGGCTPGAAIDPDDGNPCTTDACDTGTGTVSHAMLPNDSDCDDGNRCNGVAACKNGACVNGAVTVCNTPPGGCNQANGVCNPASGACTYAPVSAGTVCSDGNDCTTADECDGSGTCNGSAVPCVAPGPSCVNSSTSREFSGGTCLPGGNCDFTETDTHCDFGCNASAGLCAQDPCIGVSCDKPPSQCRVAAGTCSGGECSYAVTEGAACDDGDPCTGADECTAGGACAGTPLLCNTAPLASCVSGDTASRHFDVNGTCATGSCNYAHADVPCTFGCDTATGLCKNDPCNAVSCDQPPSQCHQAIGTCAAGDCSYELKPSGSGCSDGNPCTDTDVCSDTGACGGVQKTCNAPPPAECVGNSSRTYDAAGACDGTGSCTYASVDTACGNGCDPGSGLCNGDPCIGIVCASPPSACQLDTGTCVAGLCVYDARPSGVACDDLDPCTGGDVCNGAGLCGGTISASCVDGGTGSGGASSTDGGLDASSGGASGVDGGGAGSPGTDGSVGGANPGPDGSTPGDGSTPDGSSAAGGGGGAAGNAGGTSGNAGGTSGNAGGASNAGGTSGNAGGTASNAGGAVGSQGGTASGTGARPSGFGGLSTGAAGSTSGQAGNEGLDGGLDGSDGGDDGHGHSKDEGGCGCSVPQSTGTAPWGLALAAVGVLVARRRRPRAA